LPVAAKFSEITYNKAYCLSNFCGYTYIFLIVAESSTASLIGAAVNSEKACWFMSERCRLPKKTKNVVSPRNKVTLSPVLCSCVFLQVLGSLKTELEVHI